MGQIVIGGKKVKDITINGKKVKSITVGGKVLSFSSEPKPRLLRLGNLNTSENVLSFRYTNALGGLNNAIFSQVSAHFVDVDNGNIWEIDDWEVIKQSSIAGIRINTIKRNNTVYKIAAVYDDGGTTKTQKLTFAINVPAGAGAPSSNFVISAGKLTWLGVINPKTPPPFYFLLNIDPAKQYKYYVEISDTNNTSLAKIDAKVLYTIFQNISVID